MVRDGGPQGAAAPSTVEKCGKHKDADKGKERIPGRLITVYTTAGDSLQLIFND